MAKAKVKPVDAVVEEPVETVEEVVETEAAPASRVVQKSHCEYDGVIYASPRKALDAAKVPNAHKKAGKLLVKMRKAGGTVEFEGHTFTEVPYGSAEGKIAEWVGPQPEAIADRDAKKLLASGIDADDVDDEVVEEEDETLDA